MRDAGGGSIVNISSLAGLVGSRNGIPAYQASKGAVRLLTKSTAIQHASENIRCNSVHPGMIITAMTDEILAVPEMQHTTTTTSRSAGSAPWTTSPTASSSSPPTTPHSSPAARLVIDGGLYAQ
ncbi:Cyclopentanol dehydrogenase [Geodia barretti]|uniref:Cyclopentanol dehydrogenase n=1 Tax=Geodia barretti TaxID=519541 RepID=A0AA35QVV7_GEOBA|nr:Cyclopentanol dehydrogenase [Geodia barretti]